MMQFHLVGGFLGSGKTTAIIGAAKRLLAQGKRVGVVTNDQGKYLVDTAFFRAANFPTVEVTGGCFCCNYDDLEARLKQLEGSARPDVIFAETVGSCADIVATVVKPFLDLQSAGIPLTSYTVFTDTRLLRRRLLNQPMPFGDDVVYIFDKQIEEAGLLVINKIDLLSPIDLQATREMAQAAFPSKTVRLQNSHNSEDIAGWVGLLQSSTPLAPRTSVEIDYNRYGAGEAELAWLDEAVLLRAPANKLRESVVTLIGAVRDAIQSQRLPIGHVKFMVQLPDGASRRSMKISLPSLEEPNWEREIPALPGSEANVLINARVQARAEQLRELVKAAIERAATQSGATVSELNVDAFHPGFPRPTHRIA